MKNALPRVVNYVLRRSTPVKELERRVRKLEAALFDLQPDIVRHSLEARDRAEALLRRNGIPRDLNVNISKNDLMYQFAAHHAKDEADALSDYLAGGIHMKVVLDAVVQYGFGSFDKVDSLLDFASGYGRLTRFLLQSVDPARIWISDIKERAVRFQQQQFSVSGFVSKPQPHDLALDQRFSCVSVFSLFSHLPETSFKPWLQWVCDLVAPGGFLIFTVHDLSLLEKPHLSVLQQFPRGRKTNLVYIPSSEETAFHSEDSPLRSSSYGGTFVSEAFVADVIAQLSFENRRYRRFPRALTGFQDVYVLRKHANDCLSGLALSSC